MTVSSAPTQREQTSRDSLQVSRDYTYEEERGDGWIAFARTLLLLLGTLNVIEGIAAVSNSSFFVNGTHFIFGSLNTWGWVVMCIGLAELAVGLGVFVRDQLSRWTGIVVLSINSIAQLLMMPAYPFSSLTIFTMDLLAIYGLVAYGRQISSGS